MRVGKSVWLARRKKIANAQVAEYEKPVEIVTRWNYFTVIPASSRGGLEMMKHGEALYDTWTAIANAAQFEGKISEGDLMWIDGHEPNEDIEEAYGNGSSANAVVKSALVNNAFMSIVLTTNQSRQKKV